MRDRLSDDGVFLGNVIAYTNPADRVATHVRATVAGVFEHSEAISVGVAPALANLLIIGSPRPASVPAEVTWTEQPMKSNLRVARLTDDWNPMHRWSRRANNAWHDNIRDWFGSAALRPW